MILGLYVATTSSGLLSTWSGFGKLLRLLPGQDAQFSTYAGNRYGSATTPLTTAVLDTHPWVGYGLHGFATATDTALVEAVVLSGLIGVACVLVTVAAPVVAALQSTADLPDQRRLLHRAVAILMFASTIGSVALTGNRVSVLVWTLFGLMLVSRSGERPAEPLTEGDAADPVDALTDDTPASTGDRAGVAGPALAPARG